MKVANKKQPYNWNRVKPGDVISFRYKSKSTGKTLVQSILVLNPRLDVKLKDGKTTRHLTGIKIEESNKVSLKLNARQIALLEQIGDFKKIIYINLKLIVDLSLMILKGLKNQLMIKFLKV